MAAEPAHSEDVEMVEAPAALEKGKGREAGLSTLALDARSSLPPPARSGLTLFFAVPWVEKYRPATLDDVVAHGDIISTSA